MNKAQFLLLATACIALIQTQSTDAEGIAKHKEDIGKGLEGLDPKDPEIKLAAQKLANRLAAANPPSEEDIKSASHIGDVVIPETPLPAG